MLYLKLTILISSVRIVHAMNKGKVMKHKLSAILMAFMLTTPAAFAAPGAETGAEATTTTAGTTSATTAATTGGVAAGAVGTATVAGVATAVGVAALAVVAANDSGDGGSHNTSTTTSTR